MLSCSDISLLGRFSLFHFGFALTCQPKRKFTDAVAENQARSCLSEPVWRPGHRTRNKRRILDSVTEEKSFSSSSCWRFGNTNKHGINIPVWWNLEGFFFFVVQFWILHQVIIKTTLRSPQVTVDPRLSGLKIAFFLFLIQSKPPSVFYSRTFKNPTLTNVWSGRKSFTMDGKKLLCSNNSSSVWN